MTEIDLRIAALDGAMRPVRDFVWNLWTCASGRGVSCGLTVSVGRGRARSTESQGALCASSRSGVRLTDAAEADDGRSVVIEAADSLFDRRDGSFASALFKRSSGPTRMTRRPSDGADVPLL